MPWIVKIDRGQKHHWSKEREYEYHKFTHSTDASEFKARHCALLDAEIYYEDDE